MLRPAALGLAVLVHAAILMPALVSCASPQPTPQPQAASQRREPLTVTLLPAGGPAGAPPCEDSYVGIGFTHSYFDGSVLSVAEGGPAARAGLLVGDVVENLEQLPRWSEAGHMVLLKIERGGVHLRVTAETEVICFTP
jgi:C-terminal processing protease CtpA/Prc